MKIIVSKFFVRKGYAAMAVFPFIFFRKREYINPIRLNHEKIHLRQQVELLIVFFYLWYLIDYLIGLIKYKNHRKAYLNIVFEKEAYRYQSDLEYLKHRKIFSFLKSY